MKHLILLFLISYSVQSNSQECMARLKTGLDSVPLRMNDSIQCLLFKNEKFISYKYNYEVDIWPVWTMNDNFGFLDTNYFVLLPDEEIVRISIDTSKLFHFACNFHVTDNFNYKAISYCDLTKKAVRGNENALLKLLTMCVDMDGCAAEVHLEVIWRIFSLWSDELFYIFLMKQTSSDQITIAEFLVNNPLSFPFSDYEYYYASFYPKTWGAMQLLIN